jgi:hypothetical protein
MTISIEKPKLVRWLVGVYWEARRRTVDGDEFREVDSLSRSLVVEHAKKRRAEGATMVVVRVKRFQLKKVPG